MLAKSSYAHVGHASNEVCQAPLLYSLAGREVQTCEVQTPQRVAAKGWKMIVQSEEEEVLFHDRASCMFGEHMGR